jgi:hypothetical protein
MEPLKTDVVKNSPQFSGTIHRMQTCPLCLSNIEPAFYPDDIKSVVISGIPYIETGSQCQCCSAAVEPVRHMVN